MCAHNKYQNKDKYSINYMKAKDLLSVKNQIIQDNKYRTTEKRKLLKKEI
jgi:hypothetical protein